MSTAVVLQPGEIEKYFEHLERRLIEHISQVKVIDQPMSKAKTAKYLGCSPATVDKHYRHLRHLTPGGQPIWFQSELEKYLKQSK